MYSTVDDFRFLKLLLVFFFCLPFKVALRNIYILSTAGEIYIAVYAIYVVVIYWLINDN